MHRTSIITVCILLLVIILTRFWNIGYTARFTRDESSDLARMHSYWQAKKITLVGPISNDNRKVFSSLTYYMQLPFAAAWNFEPVGPAIGTAFWGVLTVVLIFILYHQVSQKKFLERSSLLFLVVATIWTPLLLTSRWAWNPHLVPFWIALGLVLFFTRWRWRFFFTGLCMGMSFHHHYIAVFAIGAFGLIESLLLFKQKKYNDIVQLALGYSVAILPFILFDLRHPPGLFINSYLQGNVSNVEGVTLNTLLPKLFRNGTVVMQEIVHGHAFQLAWLVAAIYIFWQDWKFNRRYLLYSLPILAQVVGPVFVDGYVQRYFLPAAVFLLVWLVVPRKGTSTFAVNAMLLLMLISSLWRMPAVLTQPVAPPPLTVVSQAERAIITLFATHSDIKNPNIATLTGSDLDSLAEKYRDLLSIRGINFRAASEYDASESLIVITTENEQSVREDKNTSMHYFKNTQLREQIMLEEKPWRVYWFSF